MTMDKAFQPEAYEGRIAKAWADAGIFRATGALGERFSLVIPPPNVTGSLHVGHALDYTLQDVVVRWQRMCGLDSLWVPGSDHAGIATQMVVEKRLREQGTSRHEIGREAFVEEVWRWKAESHGKIVSTLTRMGCSCDWTRERFTLDPGLSRAVRETFVRWYEQGLIYRGTRLINWCPSCRTALSDLEVERDEPELGELWSFAYPVEGGGEIVVATTRPETMLGDTAIAVHPADPRWMSLIGKRVMHPFFPARAIPIIGDEILADPETGTGAVKVTPAHDFNDFACGQRHGLEMLTVLAADGTMNAQAGPFAGLDRFEARKAVKQRILELGLDRGSKPHTYTLGRCQRSHTIVEPMLSTQWFVTMEPLAKPAIEAVRTGRIRIVPDAWEKTYFHWMENIQDWCISRQLWWGHRIPAWYCDACQDPIVSREDPTSCPSCGSSGLRQDEDVLDTWFSSQLWPFSVFGWPETTADLRRYYPTDLLLTGFDIIFFWVARMIVAGLSLTGEVPFRTVLLHGLVRDAQGRKMSKSLGNAIDPGEAMDRHGVDAVRFTLASQASPGSDLSLSEERLAGNRAFVNKLWNASRFLLMRAPAAGSRADYGAEDLDEIDRFLVARYADLVDQVDAAYATYRFDHASNAIYHFLWGTYCDWAIELAKPDLAEGAPERRAAVRAAVMFDVLDGALRLLHPIAPFITEELWQSLPRRGGDPAFLAIAAAPRPTALEPPLPMLSSRDAAQALVERWLIAPVAALRGLKTASNIPPSRKITAILRPRGDAGHRELQHFSTRIAVLAGCSEVRVVAEAPQEDPALRQVLDEIEITVPLAGAIDFEQERARLQRERQKLVAELEGLDAKLANPAFVERAPGEVVTKQRERSASLRGRIEELDRSLASLA